MGEGREWRKQGGKKGPESLGFHRAPEGNEDGCQGEPRVVLLLQRQVPRRWGVGSRATVRRRAA